MNRRKAILTVVTAASLPTAGCLSDLDNPGGFDEETVKEEADTIEYDELYRNVSEYEGEPVTYSNVKILGIAESEDGYQEYVLSLPDQGIGDDHYLYGNWEGDPFKENDRVELWGTVEGTTTYQSLAGEQTVPEIDLVDMNLL